LSDHATIRLELAERVATITLARPEKLNALTPTVFTELTAAIDTALAQGARAIVLTGEGRAFCSGADLSPEGDPLPADIGEVVDAAYNPFATLIAGLDVPVVTAINGLAAGAGCALALMGDISVMAQDAYLLLAFVNIGLVPDMGATWLVAKGAGRTKALEMALLGEKLSAQEALEAGLVTRVSDAPLQDAQAIAAKLAAGPTLAIAAIRKQVAAALNATLDETLAIERANQSRLGFSRDFKEAVAAFGEKRLPTFEGR
jgi:2-(1,2-epoxy-1,2-dihydrophenyl)acetyl-CoA isomerase